MTDKKQPTEGHIRSKLRPFESTTDLQPLVEVALNEALVYVG